MLILLFKASCRKNYSIEALNLLLQVEYLLSPKEPEQTKWSHYINNRCQGYSVPMNLHMEHLKWQVKIIVLHLEFKLSIYLITFVAFLNKRMNLNQYQASILCLLLNPILIQFWKLSKIKMCFPLNRTGSITQCIMFIVITSQVIWKCFYYEQSHVEHGTLYQL